MTAASASDLMLMMPQKPHIEILHIIFQGPPDRKALDNAA
jgi:hypothetical protein